MKDLPSKLANKIPKPYRRDDSDEITDEKRSLIDKESPSLVNQNGNIGSFSQRERLLVEKIEYLTQKLEETQRFEGKTTKNRSYHNGSQMQMRSSLRATPQPNQDVESVQRYMDCVDVNDADEEPLSVAPRSKLHQKPTNRARKSASNFSFNSVHSPEDTTPRQGRAHQTS